MALISSLGFGPRPQPDSGGDGSAAGDIDLDFLGNVEGRELHGYKDKGGVAVGTGFNIGQHTSGDLQNLFGDTPDLVKKLAPYVGIKDPAQIDRILKVLPLELSDEEVNTVDRRVVGQMAGSLKSAYNSQGGNWDALSPGQKTAMYSIAHQYGVGGFQKNKGNIWQQAVGGNWQGVQAALRDPNQQYASRRRKEAALLGGASSTSFAPRPAAAAPQPTQMAAVQPDLGQGVGMAPPAYIEDEPGWQRATSFGSSPPDTSLSDNPWADVRGGSSSYETDLNDLEPGRFQSAINWADKYGLRFNLATGDYGWGSTPENLSLADVYPDDKQFYEQMKVQYPEEYTKRQLHEWTHGVRNPWELHYTPIDAAFDTGFTLMGLPGASFFGKAAKLGKLGSKATKALEAVHAAREVEQAARIPAEASLAAFRAGEEGLENLAAKGVHLLQRGAPQEEQLAAKLAYEEAAAGHVLTEANHVRDFSAHKLAYDKLLKASGKLARAESKLSYNELAVTPGIVARLAGEQVGTNLASLAAYKAVDEETDSPGLAFLASLGAAPITAALMRRTFEHGGLQALTDRLASGAADERGAVGKDISNLPKTLEEVQARATGELPGGVDVQKLRNEVTLATTKLANAPASSKSFWQLKLDAAKADLTRAEAGAPVAEAAPVAAPSIDLTETPEQATKTAQAEALDEYGDLLDQYQAAAKTKGAKKPSMTEMKAAQDNLRELGIKDPAAALQEHRAARVAAEEEAQAPPELTGKGKKDPAQSLREVGYSEEAIAEMTRKEPPFKPDGPIPDEELITGWPGPKRGEGGGFEQYKHLERAPDDPVQAAKRGAKAAYDPTGWKKLAKEPVEKIRQQILTHLSDGQPRTWNRIGIELWDRHADALKGNTEDALWSLVNDEKIGHTDTSPVYFQALEGAAPAAKAGDLRATAEATAKEAMGTSSIAQAARREQAALDEYEAALEVPAGKKKPNLTRIKDAERWLRSLGIKDPKAALAARKEAVLEPEAMAASTARIDQNLEELKAAEAARAAKPKHGGARTTYGGFAPHDFPVDAELKIRELLDRTNQDIEANPELAKTTLQRLWETQFMQQGGVVDEDFIKPPAGAPWTPSGAPLVPRPIPPIQKRRVQAAQLFQTVAQRMGTLHPDMNEATQKWVWDVEHGLELGRINQEYPNLSKETFQRAQQVNVRTVFGKGQRLDEFQAGGNVVRILDKDGRWHVRVESPEAHVELIIPKIAFRVKPKDLDKSEELTNFATFKDSKVSAGRRWLLNRLPIVMNKEGEIDWDATANVLKRHVDWHNDSKIRNAKLGDKLTERDKVYLQKTIDWSEEYATKNPNTQLTPNIPHAMTGVKIQEDLYDMEALRQLQTLTDSELAAKAKLAGLEEGSERYMTLRSAPMRVAQAVPDMTPQERDFLNSRLMWDESLQKVYAGDPIERAKINTYKKDAEEAGILGRPASKGLADKPTEPELTAAGHGTKAVQQDQPKAATLKTANDPDAPPVKMTYADVKDAAPDTTGDVPKVTLRDSDGTSHTVDGEMVKKGDLNPEGLYHVTTAKPLPGEMRVGAPVREGMGGDVPFVPAFENKRDALFTIDALETSHKIADGKIKDVKTFREQIVSKDIRRGFYAALEDDKQEQLVKDWAERVDDTLGKAGDDPKKQKEALLDLYKIYLEDRAKLTNTPVPRHIGLNAYVDELLQHKPGSFRVVHVAHNGIPENHLIVRPGDRGQSSEVRVFGEMDGRALSRREQAEEMSKLMDDGLNPIKPKDSEPNPPGWDTVPKGPSAADAVGDGGGATPPGGTGPPPTGSTGSNYDPTTGLSHYQKTTWQDSFKEAKEAFSKVHQGVIRRVSPWRAGKQQFDTPLGKMTGYEYGINLIRNAQGHAANLVGSALMKTGQYPVRALDDSMKASYEHFIAMTKANETLRKSFASMPDAELIAADWRHEAGLPQVDGVWTAAAKTQMYDMLEQLTIGPLKSWAERLGTDPDTWLKNYIPRDWDLEASRNNIIKQMAVEGGLDPAAEQFLRRMDERDLMNIVQHGGAGTPLGAGWLKKRTAAWKPRGPGEPEHAYEYEMLAAGFIPRVTNPVDRYTLKAVEMGQDLARKQIVENFKGSHLYHEFRADKKLGLTAEQMLHAKNEEILKNNPFAEKLVPIWKEGAAGSVEAFAPPELAGIVPRMVERPIIAVPESLHDLLTNTFNGKKLVEDVRDGNKSITDLIRRGSNYMTAMQLAGSAFHALTTTTEASISDGAIAAEFAAAMMKKGGWDTVMEGCRQQNTTPYRYMWEHTKSFLLPGYALHRAGANPLRRGFKDPTLAERLYHGMEIPPYMADDPNLSMTHAVVQLYRQSGGFFRRPAEYEVLGQQKLYDVVKKYHEGVLTPGQAIKAIPEVTQGLTHWLFEFMIPRAKFDAFQQNVRLFLIKHPGLSADSPEVARECQHIINQIDDRFGMFNYDNMHWNSQAKNILFLMQRAPGWNYGTLRGVGGGMLDTAKLATLHGKRAYEKAVYGAAKTTEVGGVKEFTRRQGYAAALFLGIPIYGMYLQMGLTGEPPPTPDFDEYGGEDWKDRFGEWYRQLIAPKTGAKHPDGTDVRFKLPGIITDVYGWREDPVGTAWHKASPLLGASVDLIKNKNYFGEEIRDPHAGYATQAAQVGWYALKDVLPFSWTSAGQAREKGESLGSQIAQATGVVAHASARFAHTRAERVLDDARERSDPRGVVTRRQQATGSLKQEFQRSGMTENVREGLRIGSISGKQIGNARKAMVFPPIVQRLKGGRYSPEDLIEATNAMSPEELKQARPMLLHTFYQAKSKVPKEERADLEQQFREALAAVKSRAANPEEIGAIPGAPSPGY